MNGDTPDQHALGSDSAPSTPTECPVTEPAPMVDYSALNAALTGAAICAAPAEGAGATERLIEEVAEDMVAVLQRLQRLEETVDRIAARVDQVDGRVFETGRVLGGELAAQHRDLLGERKTLLARGLFNAVIGHVDALRTMHDGLQGAKPRAGRGSNRVAQQMEAIEITLITALQGMGFFEFRPAVGDAYSPATMECLDYVDGPCGVVLRVLRSGFRTADAVVRPAGVCIASPSNPATSPARPEQP